MFVTSTTPTRGRSRARGRSPTLLLGILAAAGAGCYDQPVSPGGGAPDEANDRLAITNDTAALAARVSYPEQEIVIEAVPSGAAVAGRSPATSETGDATAGMPPGLDRLRLTLWAEVEAPVIDGETVQATSTSTRSSSGFLVSYNMHGAPRLGAVDHVQSRGRNPRISSSVVFRDADVSAVALDQDDVYAAEATGAEDFASPAAVERLRLDGMSMRLAENTRAPLSSFVATSALATSEALWVTTGNTGHLFALDPDDLGVLARHPLDDARWVARDEAAGRIVVVQGTPGRLAIFDDDVSAGALTLLSTFSFPGAEVPESKSTVDVAGGKAFVAAGPEGVQIVCLEDGSILGSVPRPDPASLGLPSDVVVTNAVTVDGSLMFISNGEAGVYVATADDDFDVSGCTSQEITVLGRLRFGDGESVNHVDLENKLLVIASGLGGTKIVRVQLKGGGQE